MLFLFINNHLQGTSINYKCTQLLEKTGLAFCLLAIRLFYSLRLSFVLITNTVNKKKVKVKACLIASTTGSGAGLFDTDDISTLMEISIRHFDT